MSCIARLASLSQYFNAELVITYTARIHGQRARGAMTRAVAGYEDGHALNAATHSYCAGLHCEGGVWSMLFGLLMWDCLFADVPDTLRSQFQLAPLDLSTPHFYKVTCAHALHLICPLHRDTISHARGTLFLKEQKTEIKMIAILRGYKVSRVRGMLSHCGAGVAHAEADKHASSRGRY